MQGKHARCGLGLLVTVVALLGLAGCVGPGLEPPGGDGNKANVPVAGGAGETGSAGVGNGTSGSTGGIGGGINADDHGGTGGLGAADASVDDDAGDDDGGATH